ncbi:transcriptional regulator [Paracidovorax avenae]|nr:transcriptional regulator [Paracidovorax avenae]
MTGHFVRSFGIAVRQTRMSLGWSQERLAERSDLDRSYVGEIERGTVVASLATVSKLAQSLAVPASTLILRGEAVASARPGQEAD